MASKFEWKYCYIQKKNTIVLIHYSNAIL
uniref:Uncharacterized protein n=1 Tax=Anguilla anguilla TaxID=7936 RepID=A0A0E9Q5J1_ANGAN